MNIYDNDGRPTTIDALNERAKGWHAKYGERGEFWPDGRPASAAMSRNCSKSTHDYCSGVRTIDGTRGTMWQFVACECACHGAAA